MSLSKQCVSCGGEVVAAKQLSADKLRAELELYFSAEAPAGAITSGYTLMRCTACSLEYADPMQPGSLQFYKWISSFPTYYPKDRWEWHEVSALVRSGGKGSQATGLEVGCGSGTFLLFIRDTAGLKVVGIDMTPPSVEAARSRGLDAVLGDFDEFSAARPDAKFDYVFAFHCLEHVSDPVKFVGQCSRFLAPGGSIFISVPMSPMSFESQWFDALNHPPHHLTRWSAKSIQSLAQSLGLTVRISTEPAPSAFKRALRALHLARRGNNALPTRPSLLANALLHPLAYAKEVRTQLARDKLNGVPVGNILLAEFARP